VVRLGMFPRSRIWSIPVVAARGRKMTRAVATYFYTPKVLTFQTGVS
jgi:hypothetical protein